MLTAIRIFYSSDFSLDRDEVITLCIGIRCRADRTSEHRQLNCQTFIGSDGYLTRSFFPVAWLYIQLPLRKIFAKNCKFSEYWLGKRKFYGIGEIGIDLFWDKSFLAEQIEAFTTQISWAKSRNFPIVIHVRDSFNEVMEQLRKVYIPELRGVFHSFTGTLEQAEQIIDLGFKIGVNGIITFKNSNLGEIIQKIEPKHLLIETDSPWLAPVPHRGRRNECSYIVTVAAKIAELHNISIESIASITSQNAKELFGF